MSNLAGSSEWFTCVSTIHLLCSVKEEEGMASFSCFTSVAHIVLKWPRAVDRMSAFSHLLTWLISLFFSFSGYGVRGSQAVPQWQEGWKASEKITANRSFVLPVAHDQHLVDSKQGQHCVGPFCCGQGLWFENSNNEIVTKCEPVTKIFFLNGAGHTVQNLHLNTQVSHTASGDTTSRKWQ